MYILYRVIFYIEIGCLHHPFKITQIFQRGYTKLQSKYTNLQLLYTCITGLLQRIRFVAPIYIDLQRKTTIRPTNLFKPKLLILN
jgi:hypothetical protein